MGPQFCACERNVGTCLCFPWQRLGGWAPASSPHAPFPARPAPSSSPPSPSWSSGRRTPAPCWPARCQSCRVERSKGSRSRTEPASWITENGQREGGEDGWRNREMKKEKSRWSHCWGGCKSPHRMCCAKTVSARICEHNMERQVPRITFKLCLLTKLNYAHIRESLSLYVRPTQRDNVICKCINNATKSVL